jgi:hypothetical protein
MSTGPGNGSPQPVDGGLKPKLKLDERKSAPPEAIKATTTTTPAAKPPNRLFLNKFKLKALDKESAHLKMPFRVLSSIRVIINTVLSGVHINEKSESRLVESLIM